MLLSAVEEHDMVKLDVVRICDDLSTVAGQQHRSHGCEVLRFAGLLYVSEATRGFLGCLNSRTVRDSND